jgi:ElaA protein
MGIRFDPSDLLWQWRRFEELPVRELQYIYMARQLVFALEQRCVYLDVDGHDADSLHLAAWTPAQPVPVAYARLVAPKIKYKEPCIGRVLTTGAGRGQGLGREVVRRAIAQCLVIYPGMGIRISAQSYLEKFYGAAGFHVCGARYLEDGIEHTEMLLPTI